MSKVSKIDKTSKIEPIQNHCFQKWLKVNQDNDSIRISAQTAFLFGCLGLFWWTTQTFTPVFSGHLGYSHFFL